MKISNLLKNLPTLQNELDYEVSFERFVCLTDVYQENPNIIDPKLNEMISSLIGQIRELWILHEFNSTIIQPFKYLAHLAKIRGSKVFMSRLPHEVEDLELVVYFLEKNETMTHLKSSEVRFVCLLWLGLLCKLPFSFTLLSKCVEENDELKKTSLITRLCNLGFKMLFQYHDKSIEACCLFLGEILARKDVSCLMDNNSDYYCSGGEESETTHWIFEQTLQLLKTPNYCGHLKALKLFSCLFKRLNRSILLQHVNEIVQCVKKMTYLQSRETLIRKFSLKLIQRSALASLSTESANWLYKKETKTLLTTSTVKKLENLHLASGDSAEMVVENTTLIGNGDQQQQKSISEENLEFVIDCLLKALKDKDTIVRWSAAKGVGRIASKLPIGLAKHVADLVLANFNSSQSDAAWHGGCLALAEMSRRGCLLPSQLGAVIDAIVSALAFDQLKMSYSIGSHVRDAASYAAWSLARNFDAHHMTAQGAAKLGPSLVCAALFDPEISCRRAASAAFQEIVGRLPGVFSDGLNISATIDYFAVGSRSNCYKNICIDIGKHDSYLQPLITHLLKHRLNHFDHEIRLLASQALSGLFQELKPTDQTFLLTTLKENCQQKDSFNRSGSLLALAEIIQSNPRAIVIDIEYFELIDKLLQPDFIDGIGGEITRFGLNRLIVALFNSIEDSGKKFMDEIRTLKWIDLLLSNLKPNPKFALADALLADARQSMKAVAKSSCDQVSIDFKKSIIDRLLKQIADATLEVEAISSMYGLGSLAEYVDKCTVEIILQIILDCMNDKSIKMKLWVEFRSSCINTALEFIGKISIMCNGDDLLRKLADIFNSGAMDFTVSPKGDIGCCVRLTSIRCISTVLKNCPRYRSIIDIVKRHVQQLIELCGDKIDTVRLLAFQEIKSILMDPLCLAGIAEKQELEKSITDLEDGVILSEFDFLINCLKFDSFDQNAMIGLINGIGSLNESLCRQAKTALLNYVGDIKENVVALLFFMQRFTGLCDRIDQENRLIIPMLKSIDILLASDHLIDFDSRQELDIVFKFVQKKCQKSVNQERLTVAISICCLLLQFWDSFDADFVEKPLGFLLQSLKHKFPFVRQKTAEKMQEALLKWGKLDNHNELVLGMLAGTNWMQHTEKNEHFIEVVREIALLLNVVD